MPGPAGAKLTLAVLTTVPLAWRTVAPLAAVVVTTGGYALAVLLGVPVDEPLVPLLAPLVAIYSLGAHGSVPGIVAGGGAALVAYSVALRVGDGRGGIRSRPRGRRGARGACSGPRRARNGFRD